MTPENGETGNAFEEVDIFKMELSGALWRGAFSSFEDAQTRIKQLLVSDPGEFSPTCIPVAAKSSSSRTELTDTPARGNNRFRRRPQISGQA